MKKSLIAIAVAAALPAFAQAQTNVQLYGIVDTSIGVADVGGSGSNTEVVVLSGVQSTSRFGFRGTESLGGGLSAIFNYEAGVGSTHAPKKRRGHPYQEPPAQIGFEPACQPSVPQIAPAPSVFARKSGVA